MRMTCPDCDVPLVPIQLFRAQELEGGLHYADADRPKSGFGWKLAGVVHGARCPRCNRVLFYAFPDDAETDVHKAREAFEGAERRRYEAEANALFKEARSAKALPQATAEELIAIFRASDSGEELRAGALETMAAKCPPETWIPVLQREAAELPQDSELVAVAVRLLCESDHPSSRWVLARLSRKVRWNLRLKIIDRVAEGDGEQMRTALAGLLDDALADRLPSVAVAAIQAVTRFGPSERIQRVLLEVLDFDDDRLVCVALDALGEIGALEVVSHVRELTSGFFRPRLVKEAAEDALERLRERHNAAPDGALSVSESERGGLSEAPMGGGLSETGDED